MRGNVDNVGYLGFTKQVEVHASRAIDATVYHNTSGRPMLVSISCVCNFGDVINAYSDANATPTTIVVSMGHSNIQPVGMSLTFLVLPGNYYKINQTGTSTLSYWVEYT